MIASSTGGCNTIYTIDLNAQTSNVLLNPSGSFGSIKDLMFVSNVPTDNCNGEELSFSLSRNTFFCEDIGTASVTVTATDSSGNESSCTATVTVIDNMAPVITCVDDLVVNLDEFGNASIDETDLLISATDNCTTSLIYTVSQTDFDCTSLTTGSTETELISNGSFESDLSDWNSIIENGTDGSGNGNCQLKWFAADDSTGICCCVNDVFPTDGTSAAFTSFDNNVANTIYRLEQTVSLPGNFNDLQLSFDWLGEFNLTFGATIARDFIVNINDSANNTITTVYSSQIPPNEITSVSEFISLNITSDLLAYAGQDVTLSFVAVIPEASSGPAKSLVDNVSLIASLDSNVFPVTVTAMDASGNLSSCTTTVTVTDTDDHCEVLSTDSFEASRIGIYPNPTNDQVTISTPDFFIEEIEIINLKGSSIRTIKQAENLSETTINLSNLSSGVYLMKIKGNNSVYMKKIIKN